MERLRTKTSSRNKNYKHTRLTLLTKTLCHNKQDIQNN